MQIIQEQDFSPSPKRPAEPDKDKLNLSVAKQKSGPSSTNPASASAYKSTKSTQNKSIMILKTINSGVEAGSKTSSPRKSEILKNQDLFRQTTG
jgi:hypothetical protein